MDKYVVRMMGGLANRMLQYSYSIYLRNQGYNVLQDNSYKPKKWAIEELDWNRIFPKATIDQASKWLMMRYGGGYDYISKLRLKYIPKLTKTCKMPSAFDIPSVDQLKSYRHFIGIFHHAKMIDQVLSEVQSLFEFSPFAEGSRNDVLANKIINSNSIAIHVRKGKDYQTRDAYEGTCPIEYYLQAIEYIKAKESGTKLYVFTDNPDWVRDNFKNFNYVLVEGNPASGWGNHFDMQLMSLCKHNIIANSTYSWWGAVLNKNSKKTVICPAKWFNENVERYKGLNNFSICEGWISM